MANETDKKPGMRRGVRILLIGSLALNLLVVGVVGGAVVGHMRDGDSRDRSDRFGSPYVRALNVQDKRIVGKAIRDAYRQAEIDREGSRRSYERVVGLLRAAPLDQNALTQEVAQQDIGGEQRRKVAQKIWLDRVFSMTDTERATYADDLEDVLKRGSKKKTKEKRD
ncbi:periplasmic heavy metal sensor [Shimia sp.]|uniref:periplasmic heavy metal sensor n=1 Tax=Shimia sp. TaxID=1954381 RepID=UPI00329A6A50